MLKLYMKRRCPHCRKVVDENHDSIGADLNLLYIEHEENLRDLMAAGGKRQTPFLVDEERQVTMYESDDIIEYLADTYGG